MINNIIDKRLKYIECRPVVDEDSKEKMLVCSVNLANSDKDGIDSEGVRVAEVIFNLDEKGRPNTVRSIRTDGISDDEVIKTLKKYVGPRRW